jgi:hypothetical protein
MSTNANKWLKYAGCLSDLHTTANVFAKWINIKAKMIQMKNLQELITKWKKEASDMERKVPNESEHMMWSRTRGKIHRLRQCITEAELLLCSDTGAITETAHFANTMLGEVPPEVERPNIDDAAAGSSETLAVRQNEQTKEVCPYCVANPCICWDNMR